MSLSSHLEDKNSPVRNFLRTQFPNTRGFLKDARKSIREAGTIRPDGDLPWSTIGTALDYRIRYYFDVTPNNQLVAHQGARILAAQSDALTNDQIGFYLGPLMSGCTELFDNLNTFLDNNHPVGRRLPQPEEDQLNRYCYVLALLEQVFRAGLRPGSPLAAGELSSESMIQIAESHWLDDLRSLSWNFYDQFGHLLELPHKLNPKFDGSLFIGGADADLIIDGRLVDIKTTVNARIESNWIWQLIGYVLLDYSDFHRINGIGLYMARQGILLEWDLDEAIRDMSTGTPYTVEELREQFKGIVSDLPSARPEVVARRFLGRVARRPPNSE